MSSVSSVKPSAAVPASREPLLFTPGPLTTSYTVKQAMLRDLGSRDDLFLKYISEIQTDLLAAAHTSRDAGYECVIMQGSGTFAVESVITSTIPRENAKVLVVINGAYGHRMQKIADTVGIPTTSIEVSERERPTVEAVIEAVRADKSITHMGLIHHETTSGILNEAADICKVRIGLISCICLHMLTEASGSEGTARQQHYHNRGLDVRLRRIRHRCWCIGRGFPGVVCQ